MKAVNDKIPTGDRLVVWFSKVLRWAVGTVFCVVGILHADEGGFPAIVLGLLIMVTGFFKPTRCLGGNCSRPVEGE